MPESRREFLARTAAGLAGAVAAGTAFAEQQPPSPTPTNPAAGTPPAFGTAPPVGPEIAVGHDHRGAEARPAGVHARREGPDRRQLATVDGRHDGAPHRAAQSRARDDALARVALEPAHPGRFAGARPRPLRRGATAKPGPLPEARRRHRLRDGRRAVAVDRVAGADLREADEDLPRPDRAVRPEAAGASSLRRRSSPSSRRGAPTRRSRPESTAGALHGIPFGVKDLLDTKGILTTYGAEPYRNRVPDADAVVVDRLYKAGAVLVAKLSLGVARAQRHLVRRPDDESLAPRGGLGGLERRSGRGDRRGARRASRSAARRAAASSIPRCAAASRACVRRSAASPARAR